MGDFRFADLPAPPPRRQVAVLGGGMWGCVLAQHLAGKDKETGVRLWEFVPALAASLKKTRRHAHLPGFRLDGAVQVTDDLAAAARDADVLLFVLPSKALAATAKNIRALVALKKTAVAVNASKGVEPGTLATMGDVVARELPALRGKVWTLTGPSFAREVARGVPTGLLLGGPSGPRARALAALFDGGALSVTPCPDRVGVELGGSLKNAIAIGAGILDGLGAGANTKAALFVKGLDEMARLIRARGGRAGTIYGLAGLGDLIATGTSRESRNRSFGEKLGRGLSPRRALAQIPTVVEGVEAAARARELCRRLQVKAPLLEAIWRATRGARARGVLKSLGF
ncbi:MAG: NAD(P)H-dependent glycerol-3-phosphate dehydrogenase [Elusimicrobia bacterium]|nr:NAD(P)H-dependent glycerol-3-phosphate dehydrogenase [Elusimicrobiota bacterium]